MELTKSRDIPIQDLYTLLQLEFISYKIREKIYKRQEDKKKFNDICNMKRKKIENMSSKNCIPSIFNSSPEYLQKYISKFINDFGIPNFQYRDDYKTKIYGHWDKIYWFYRGTEIKTMIKGELKLGTVEKCHDDNVTIIVENEKMDKEFSEIGRILTDEFLKLE